jgi:hypothetical protein
MSGEFGTPVVGKCSKHDVVNESLLTRVRSVMRFTTSSVTGSVSIESKAVVDYNHRVIDRTDINISTLVS